MTPAQQTAFRSPCFEPEETQQRRFTYRLPFPLDDVSVNAAKNLPLAAQGDAFTRAIIAKSIA